MLYHSVPSHKPPSSTGLEDIEIYYISKCMHFIAHLMEVIMLLHQQIYETGVNITLHCLERDINTWAWNQRDLALLFSPEKVSCLH